MYLLSAGSPENFQHLSSVDTGPRDEGLGLGSDREIGLVPTWSSSRVERALSQPGLSCEVVRGQWGSET